MIKFNIISGVALLLAGPSTKSFFTCAKQCEKSCVVGCRRVH